MIFGTGLSMLLIVSSVKESRSFSRGREAQGTTSKRSQTASRKAGKWSTDFRFEHSAPSPPTWLVARGPCSPSRIHRTYMGSVEPGQQNVAIDNAANRVGTWRSPVRIAQGLKLAFTDCPAPARFVVRRPHRSRRAYSGAHSTDDQTFRSNSPQFKAFLQAVRELFVSLLV